VTKPKSKSKLVVVANRLPVHRVHSGGEAHWQTSPGGLVSALTPVLQTTEGAWVGWAGIGSETPAPFEHEGVSLYPVPLSNEEINDYYYGFCNGTIWPLYHDAVRTPEFHRHWWRPYVEVNRRFATAVAEILADGGTAWIQDYHLQLVPAMLRELRPKAKIGFFLHIPFPPVELFAQLPWRRNILEGLMGGDLVGFQTRLGAQNFQRASRRFADAKRADAHSVLVDHHKVRVDRFPISIDFERFSQMGDSPEVLARATKLRGQLGQPKTIILGVDRLDYTKGIDIRLRAYEALLARRRRLNVVLVQIAVPSRESVAEYAQIRTRIERLVGQINGEYGDPPRVPVHYLYRSLPAELLASYYRAADIMLVTPLRDGMNLVAKEYVATRTDNSGTLVLSEFTGAAQELKQAILVNPHDIDGLAAALDEALSLEPEEMKHRMMAMRRTVRRHDVHHWAQSFLEALSEAASGSD